MRKSLYFAIVSGVSFLALNATAAVPSGCVDNGDGTCSYQDKNATSVYDTANGRIISKEVVSTVEDMGHANTQMNYYSYTYDNKGNLSSMLLTQQYGGYNPSTSTKNVYYTYDSNNNLLSVTAEGGQMNGDIWTSNRKNAIYGTDSEGNRTITQTNGQVLTYNADGILIKETRDNGLNAYTWVYDNNGALLSSTTSSRDNSCDSCNYDTSYNVTYNADGSYQTGYVYENNKSGNVEQNYTDKYVRNTDYIFDDGMIGTKETYFTTNNKNGEMTENDFYYNDGDMKISYTKYPSGTESLYFYDNGEYIGTGHMGKDGRIADKKISTNTGYLEEIYTRDENGSIMSVLENTYDKNNNLLSSRTKTYNEDGSYDVASSDGKVTHYDKNGNQIREPRAPKRIYTIEEAEKVSKKTGNTFRLRYK